MNTGPARGMRDFLPEDLRRRQYVIGVIAEVYQKYGFEPLETPAVENIETLLGKYGEEGDKLIFKILKRGEGAATGAAELAQTLARYPEVASRLVEAERISDRRWRLKLDNRATIELPADDEVAALEDLTRDAALVKRIEAGNATLDFRGPGRVAIRSEPEAAATASAPTPGS